MPELILQQVVDEVRGRFIYENTDLADLIQGLEINEGAYELQLDYVRYWQMVDDFLRKYPNHNHEGLSNFWDYVMFNLPARWVNPAFVEMANINWPKRSIK